VGGVDGRGVGGVLARDLTCARRGLLGGPLALVATHFGRELRLQGGDLCFGCFPLLFWHLHNCLLHRAQLLLQDFDLLLVLTETSRLDRDTGGLWGLRGLRNDFRLEAVSGSFAFLGERARTAQRGVRGGEKRSVRGGRTDLAFVVFELEGTV